jgi:hypothetical protein
MGKMQLVQTVPSEITPNCVFKAAGGSTFAAERPPRFWEQGAPGSKVSASLVAAAEPRNGRRGATDHLSPHQRCSTCGQGAGIPKGTPTNAHEFRHAFAIRMLDSGYDLVSVSQWLGHHSPEFTAAVYAICSEEQLRKRHFSDPK